jgi:hypothetical protein
MRIGAYPNYLFLLNRLFFMLCPFLEQSSSYVSSSVWGQANVS